MRLLRWTSLAALSMALLACDDNAEKPAGPTAANAQNKAPVKPETQAGGLVLPGAEQEPQGQNPDQGLGHDPDSQPQPQPDPDAEQKPEQPKPDPNPDPDSGGQEPKKEERIKPIDLPKITGKCPDMHAGGILPFRAKGMNKHRLVQVWADPKAKGKKGPLVFYWHGTGMNPAEAAVGLGPIIEKVTSMGGMVVAPFRDIESGVFPWYLVLDLAGHRLDDLLLADEVLACAMDQVGIDTTRIHTLGLSAGGLQSTQMSYRRSNYIASSVIYSGGLIIDPPPSKDPRNKFSSMIFHGGPADIVILPFALTSERFLKALKDNDQFGFMCSHFTGHIIPPFIHDSVWKFFEDHPFGAKSPYPESGLPEGFPPYCHLRNDQNLDELLAGSPAQ